jgi:hypothetical protein
VTYCGGFTLAVPRYWFDLNGHELENRVTGRFLPLRAYGSTLKLRVIERALRDVPAYIPTEVKELFRLIIINGDAHQPGASG